MHVPEKLQQGITSNQEHNPLPSSQLTYWNITLKLLRDTLDYMSLYILQ